MAFPEQLGIVTTFVIIAGVLAFAYVHYFENDFVLGVLIDVTIAVSIAFSVWFLTTKKERKNRKYVRNRIVTFYLEIISICEGLIQNEQRRIRIEDFLEDIRNNYCRIIRYAETHSNLLDAEEIETIFDEEELVEFFIDMISEEPEDINNITEFYNSMLLIWRRYIRVNKLTDFNENEYEVAS